MANINLPKIGWQNGTLVSKAKVEIGGTIYEVDPEEYSGATPLSAENLIQMEDNTETGLNQLLSIMQGTTLYEDTTGTTGTVTFSQNITNAMKRIKISGYSNYSDTLFYFTQEFDININGKLGLMIKSYDGGINSYFDSEILILTASSITRGSQYRNRLPNTERTEMPIYITKVVVYEY